MIEKNVNLYFYFVDIMKKKNYDSWNFSGPMMDSLMTDTLSCIQVSWLEMHGIHPLWIDKKRCTVFCRINAPARINAPDFWFWLTISHKLFNRSESYFQPRKFRYSGVHPATFIEIRQRSGFVVCLCARRVYSAKYGIFISHFSSFIFIILILN